MSRVKRTVGPPIRTLLSRGAALACLLAPISSAAAQQAEARPPGRQPGQQPARPQAGARAVPQGRAQLEQRLRLELARRVRERLGLTEDQLQKLGEVNRKHEEERRELVAQERDIRIGLQEELLATTPNQERIARLLDGLSRAQHRRLEVHDQEQRELARFLTPLQRAQYAAMQERFRRRMEEMRRSNQQQRRRQLPGRGGAGARPQQRPVPPVPLPPPM